MAAVGVAVASRDPRVFLKPMLDPGLADPAIRATNLRLEMIHQTEENVGGSSRLFPSTPDLPEGSCGDFQVQRRLSETSR